MLPKTSLSVFTETVFSYLLGQANLAEEVRFWLNYDSLHRSFREALTNAFANSLHTHPHLIADEGLFNKYFLTPDTVPLLANFLLHRNTLDPVELATIWTSHIGLNDVISNQEMPRLVPIASDFLRYLEVELHAHPEFKMLQVLNSANRSSLQVAQNPIALQQVPKYQNTMQQPQGTVIGDNAIVFNQFIAKIGELPIGYTLLDFSNAYNVIKQFIAGIQEFSNDYATRVFKFLIEYLGAPNRPVPFGGRREDLAYLNGWVDDPSAAPYLLLATKSGLGKSALLAKWSRILIERSDLAVVYFPISHRFRTNLASVVFPAIVARLAELHGDPIPTKLSAEKEDWHQLLTNYMARPLSGGRRLIVILDGVDEAADWQPSANLFPLDLPVDTHIVFSASYLSDELNANAWLERLELRYPRLINVLPLYPLDQLGILDVLQQMNFSSGQLSHYDYVANELFSLSKGDPLLVRLYVEILKYGDFSTHLQLEYLRSIQPGLDGYFDRWWEDQRRTWGHYASLYESKAHKLLSLLSSAFGPLNRVHLMQLTSLEVEVFENILQSLKQFIIGDGGQLGYTFRHSLLGDHFYKRLTELEHKEIEDSFLQWGQTTLAALFRGRLPPKNVPAYLVQYYGFHLERSSSAPAMLLALTSDSWRQAWEDIGGNYVGFLNDVERAWLAVEQIDQDRIASGELAPLLADEIVCALSYTRIKGHTDNTSFDSEEEQKKDDICSATQGPLKVLAPQLSPELLLDAWEAITSIKNDRARVDVLAVLAPHLPPEYFSTALEVACSIQDKGDRAKALASLVDSLTNLPLTKLYLLWCKTLHALAMRSRADLTSDLTIMAPIIAKLGDTKAVLVTLQAISSDITRRNL